MSHQEQKTGLLWFQLHSQNNGALGALLSCAQLSSAPTGTLWECAGLAAPGKRLPQGANAPQPWLRLLRMEAPLCRRQRPFAEGSPHQGAELGGRNESWVAWQPEPKSMHISDSSSKGMGPGVQPPAPGLTFKAFYTLLPILLCSPQLPSRQTTLVVVFPKCL